MMNDEGPTFIIKKKAKGVTGGGVGFLFNA